MRADVVLLWSDLVIFCYRSEQTELLWSPAVNLGRILMTLKAVYSPFFLLLLPFCLGIKNWISQISQSHRPPTLNQFKRPSEKKKPSMGQECSSAGLTRATVGLFHLSSGFMCAFIWLCTNIGKISWANECWYVFVLLTNPEAASLLCLTSIVPFQHSRTARLTRSRWLDSTSGERTHNQLDLDQHISELQGKMQRDSHRVAVLTALHCHLTVLWLVSLFWSTILKKWANWQHYWRIIFVEGASQASGSHLKNSENQGKPGLDLSPVTFVLASPKLGFLVRAEKVSTCWMLAGRLKIAV